MKQVAFVFPTMWDSRQLSACRADWADSFDVQLLEPSDEACPAVFDVGSYIDTCVERFRGRLDGIVSSSDYPGASVAAAIATALRLPGSGPENVLRCSHKYYSRVAQRAVAPEATAGFHLVDSAKPSAEITFPCFLKPVKGAFSILSRKVRNREELEACLARPAVADFVNEYMLIFNQLVSRFTDFEFDGRYFLAEELLTGKQVTVEGFVVVDEVHILGIVDSIRDPRTKSFSRFDYPSVLPRAIQARMTDICARVIRHLGLSNTLFNVEMMYNERQDRIAIVEINPRICGQFADLYAKVDGTHGYEVALRLAAGETPAVKRRRGEFRVASSFPLRIYRPQRVVRAPSSVDVRAVEKAFSQTLVWSECASGDVLSDFESAEDGNSARYAVVNVGAPDRDRLGERIEEITRELDYRFEST